MIEELRGSSYRQADFPLLDLPLILSLISDLNPAELASSISSATALQDIRDTLAILEAGMVPDDQPDAKDHLYGRAAVAVPSGADNPTESSISPARSMVSSASMAITSSHESALS